MSICIFGDCANVNAVHRAELPPGINGDEALLKALAVALRFPDYFGGNWDSVDECIGDLSWLSPGNVALIRRDLPLADNRAGLSVYLSVLRGAVENWETKGSNLIYASPEKWDATGEGEMLAKRKFFVIFPPAAQWSVENVLSEARNS